MLGIYESFLSAGEIRFGDYGRFLFACEKVNYARFLEATAAPPVRAIFATSKFGVAYKISRLGLEQETVTPCKHKRLHNPPESSGAESGAQSVETDPNTPFAPKNRGQTFRYNSFIMTTSVP